MAEEKPRLARLAAILTQLQSKSLVTSRDIADKHAISLRTVYRDIKTLRRENTRQILRSMDPKPKIQRMPKSIFMSLSHSCSCYLHPLE